MTAPMTEGDKGKARTAAMVKRAAELGLLCEAWFHPVMGNDAYPDKIMIKDREEWIDKEFEATSLSASDHAEVWLDGFEQGRLSSDDAHLHGPQHN